MVSIRAKKAFTILELLVVIALIGVIFAFIAPRIARYITQAGQAEIKFKMAGVTEALQEFRMNFGRYPSSKEGLMALVENPYPQNERFKRNEDKWPFVKEDTIMDKSGNEFIYNCPPEKFRGKYKYFEILYLGPSGSEDDPNFLADGM